MMRDMAANDVRTALQVNAGRRVRITFADGVVWSVDVQAVDDEGFLHSGPDGADPAHYWTRFDSAILVEPSTAQR